MLTITFGIAITALSGAPAQSHPTGEPVRLAVILTNEDGSAWPAGPRPIEELEELSVPALRAEEYLLSAISHISVCWPGDPTIFVWHCRRAIDGGVILAGQVDPSSREGAAQVFEVERGERYLLFLRGGDVACQSRIVDVARDAERVDVSFLARPAAPQGELRVRASILDPDQSSSRIVWMALEDVTTGLRLLHTALDRDEELCTLRAPAGRYRLVAVATPPERPNFSQHTRGPFYGEQHVDVLPETMSEISIDLRATGSLALSVTGEVLEQDRTAILADWPNLDAPALNACSSRARVLLLRPGAPPMELVHDFDSHELDIASAAECAPWVRSLGTWWIGDLPRQTLQIPVGDAELVAIAPGGRVVRRFVTVTSGRPVLVELSFGPESTGRTR